jgi:hypothetical protein
MAEQVSAGFSTLLADFYRMVTDAVQAENGLIDKFLASMIQSLASGQPDSSFRNRVSLPWRLATQSDPSRGITSRFLETSRTPQGLTRGRTHRSRQASSGRLPFGQIEA